MKYLPHLLVCLFLGLSVSCAPVASGQNSTTTASELKLTAATPGQVSTATPAPTFTVTHTPPPVPTLTSTPSPSATFTPASTPTLAPTSTPTPLPSATPAPAHTSTLTPTTLPPVAPGSNTSAQVERGFEVYKQQYCGLCHQLDAAGTAGQFGPTHNGIGVTAEQRLQEAQYTGAATTAAEYIHESIVNPKAYLVAGFENTQHQMPVYVHLSEADVDALVQMLLQQK